MSSRGKSCELVCNLLVTEGHAGRLSSSHFRVLGSPYAVRAVVHWSGTLGHTRRTHSAGAVSCRLPATPPLQVTRWFPGEGGASVPAHPWRHLPLSCLCPMRLEQCPVLAHGAQRLTLCPGRWPASGAEQGAGISAFLVMATCGFLGLALGTSLPSLLGDSPDC